MTGVQTCALPISISYPIKEVLKDKNVQFVLIFGSFAKGKYDTESDVDLLVVGGIKQQKVFSLLRPIEELISREINPVVWTLKDLKENRKKSFVRDIVSKDKIMIIGDENEFRRIVKN